MLRKSGWFWLVLAVLALVLAACQPTPTPTEAPTEAPTKAAAPTKAPTKAPEPTEEPTEAPTPTPTPFVLEAAEDEVVFGVEGDPQAAIKRLQAGEVDVYAFTVSNPEIYKTVQEDPNIKPLEFFGVYNELTFNPVGPEFNNGKLNPFSVPRIREAMNWLVDRNYIAQEIMGGLAVPKYLPITSAFPDYARYIDKVRELEAKYAYNPEMAKQVITEEMEKLGAEMRDGKWYYKDEPVTIIMLIRVEDERKQIGDYVANQLEDLGFTVDRQYKTSKEASPIWIGGDPAEGQWHIYTGGWITTAVDRDQGDNFDFFYTPRGIGVPLWQAYKPAPEFDEIAERLANNDFATLDERDELFRRALELSLQDSVRVWLVDQKSFSVVNKDVSVAYDLAGGVSGSALWPFTIDKAGKLGIRWINADLFVDPWNPVNGSDWIYDMQAIRATVDDGLMPDPYTGLAWPERIEKAEVYAVNGTPIRKTLDWVTLEFVDEIQVPEDAWADWDAKEQRFITAAERFPDGATAKVKIVVTYPADLYEKVKWHDGSPFSPADFIFGFILGLDRGKEDSPYFDESAKPAVDSFLKTFKGLKIISTDPFTFEYYTDTFALDAENTVVTLWPNTDYGEAAWHAVAVGLLAEENKEAAFSADKAKNLEVEWLNYLSGPTIEILKKYLDQAAEENFIPYKNVLGEYITEEEAQQRWANYKAWVEEMGHFWIGTGPFYVAKVYPTEKVLVLKQNPNFPDPRDKWARFGEPMIATAVIEGPDTVSAAEGATFDVKVTYKDQPYPLDMIEGVKYLVFDENNNLVTSGEAEAVEDGLFRVTLTADALADAEPGSYRLEVAVTSKAVSIPALADYDFGLTP